MNNQTIYAVQARDWDDLDSVHAIFDSLEKAENFLARFKTKQDLRIIDLILNPDFISDKNQDPYRVELAGTKTIPDDVSICTSIEDGEEALAQTFLVEVCASPDIEQADFSVKVFAQSPEEAIDKAVKIRNEGIARGDWQTAHLEMLTLIKKLDSR